MGLKDLIFINPDGEDKNKPKTDVQKTFKSKFPVTSTPVTETATATPTTSQPTNAITPQNPACEPHMDKIMSMYEQGFDNLNQDGYDFYEFFKAVVQAGVNNPQMYTMALTMGQAMDKTVSKEKLIQQSQFYVTEINKVHTHYVQNGNAKREDTIRIKNSEEAALGSELEDINNEIARLTALKVQKESELSTIDGKYSPQITEIECKLMANDIAKESIVGSIQKVIDGINKNL